MTRFGLILFNILLVGFVYLLVYMGGAHEAAVRYALQSFSEPYIALILLMIVISTIRWFMTHNPDIARETVTWIHLFWLVPLLTVGAIYLIGGLQQGHMLSDLHHLITWR